MKVYNLSKDKLSGYDAEHHVWIIQSGDIREIAKEFNLVIRTGYVYRCDANGHVSPLKSTIRKNGLMPTWIQLGKCFGFDSNWMESLAKDAKYYDVVSKDVKFGGYLAQFGL